jgi:hypothetical protein
VEPTKAESAKEKRAAGKKDEAKKNEAKKGKETKLEDEEPPQLENWEVVTHNRKSKRLEKAVALPATAAPASAASAASTSAAVAARPAAYSAGYTGYTGALSGSPPRPDSMPTPAQAAAMASQAYTSAMLQPQQSAQAAQADGHGPLGAGSNLAHTGVAGMGGLLRGGSKPVAMSTPSMVQPQPHAPSVGMNPQAPQFVTKLPQPQLVPKYTLMPTTAPSFTPSSQFMSVPVQSYEAKGSSAYDASSDDSVLRLGEDDSYDPQDDFESGTHIPYVPPSVPLDQSTITRGDFEFGVIFGCTPATFEECMRIRLLGLRRKHISLVKSIIPLKTALFLFDFETKLLHGVYEATSQGGDNINPKAWTSNKKSRSSPYPAQVRFQTYDDCIPLPESEYERVMEYYDKKHKHFSFKLRRQQVDDLIAVFHEHHRKVQQRIVPDPRQYSSMAVSSDAGSFAPSDGWAAESSMVMNGMLVPGAMSFSMNPQFPMMAPSHLSHAHAIGAAPPFWAQRGYAPTETALDAAARPAPAASAAAVGQGEPDWNSSCFDSQFLLSEQPPP